jgi:hypothetical protein
METSNKLKVYAVCYEHFYDHENFSEPPDSIWYDEGMAEARRFELQSKDIQPCWFVYGYEVK